MTSQELRELIQELVQAVSLAMQSGEQLPDEFLGQIAQTLELLYNRLEEVEAAGQDIPPTPPSGRPDIQEAMPSSNVEGFARDENTGKLYVRFLGKHPNRMGPVYEYSGVPDSMYNLFRQGAVPARTNGQNKWGKWWKGKSPSMGASVNVLLKQGGFNYRRVG